MNWMDRITWACDVCGRTRGDRMIDVTKRPISGLEESFPSACRNVKHCNDNAECVAYAGEPGPWKGPPKRGHAGHSA